MASTSGSNVPHPTSSSTEGSGAAAGTASNGSSATMAGSAQPVVDRVAEKAHRVVDQLAGKAGPAVDRVRDTVYSAKDTMGRRMEDLTHTKDEWVESARESVRRNPITAVGIALAVGYALARLTSQR